MSNRVFAKTRNGLPVEWLSTTFDATNSDDVRPDYENKTEADFLADGWLPVLQQPQPTTEPGYAVAFDGWAVGADAVTGAWIIVQRPQPFPSWSWVEGEGWQPPTPMPSEGEWSWDEDTLTWVEVTA